MKVTKWLMAGALTLSLSSTIFSSANAATENEGTIYGGWSEDTGYFNNFMEKSGISLFATTPNHTASKDYKTGGSLVYERVIADTTWKGEYHYSRARYEWHVSGSVESDSGRVWGNDVTKAVSGWNSGDYVVAKTYYGK